MKLNVAGLTKTMTDVKGMISRTQSLKAALELGAQDIRTLIDNAFKLAQNPDTGEGWKRLAQSTIDRRRKASSKPLIDTGRLRGSITTSATDRTITYGTNVEYGGFHQFGTSRIPQRAFLPTGFEPGSPAGKIAERIRTRIRNYILTGRPTTNG